MLAFQAHLYLSQKKRGAVSVIIPTNFEFPNSDVCVPDKRPSPTHRYFRRGSDFYPRHGRTAAVNGSQCSLASKRSNVIVFPTYFLIKRKRRQILEIRSMYCQRLMKESSPFKNCPGEGRALISFATRTGKTPTGSIEQQNPMPLYSFRVGRESEASPGFRCVVHLHLLTLTVVSALCIGTLCFFTLLFYPTLYRLRRFF